MAKAKFIDVDSSVTDMAARVQKAWWDRLGHVKPHDVYYVFKDAANNNFKAKTNITNGLYRALTGKKIIIQIHKQEWVQMNEVERALLLYRELYRIDTNDKDKTEYKLIREDVKDFRKILEKIGLNNETVEQFFAKVTTPEEAAK